MSFRVLSFSLVLLVLTTAVAPPSAKAGVAIRLEKEVPQSSVRGVNPITAKIFPSQTATSAAAEQNFKAGDLMVSLLDTLSGAPMYRVRMDFTNTDALTMAMDLYWEFWLGGQMMGRREKVPQSAAALFAAEALDADMLDGRHASDLDTLYVNESQAAAITAGMIESGAVGLAQIASECSNGQTLVQSTSGWQCAAAAACIDGDFVGCYEGAAGTVNVGPCTDGVRSCSGGAWGACVGQVVPTVETCDGVDNDCNGSVDDSIACFPASGSAQILAARSAADGAVSLPITSYVTYTKDLVGSDAAGFFVQAEAAGPALFVAVDPATLLPVPAPGDLVSFTVTAMGTSFTLRQATAITGYTVDSSGHALAGLVQDLSAAADLVSALDSYESEIIALDGTVVTGPFAGAGTGFVSAAIDTAFVTGNVNLRLRLPATLQASLRIEQGCIFSLNDTPLWRFNAQAQPSAWVADDITLISCPAPQITGASSTSATTVLVSFDSEIDPGSVLANGSQFSFDGGLTALSAAFASPSTIQVTTSSQSPGLGYTVTVAGTVTDFLGTGIDAAANSASFTGYDPAGGLLVINEVDYDQPGMDYDEFVEILNPTGSPVDLTNLALVLVNGGDGMDYTTIDLSAAGSLAAGDYLVVGSVTVPNVDITFGAGANNIQNGLPDGVAIVNTVTEVVFDALSYEGEITAATITGFAAPVNLVEGTATSVEDSAAVDGSLSRCPDGLDTNDAANDWAFSTAATPGTANSTCP